jgi:hypothetical protein
MPMTGVRQNALPKTFMRGFATSPHNTNYFEDDAMTTNRDDFCACRP